jgi:ABC-type multidrug transport system ATPase subunit
VNDQPVNDEPVNDQPVTDQPRNDEPMTDQPVTRRHPGGAPAIVTAGLTKRYGPATASPALAPLDLTIAAGSRVALVGHNGSGKSTLLRLLTGLLSPSGGSATIAGHPAGSLPARAALSYAADQPVFYDDLSLWEHLEYVAGLHATVDAAQRSVDLLEVFGLTARADDLPTTFSRGLGQKAALCLAFVRPFEVLLVDEPFVGLDRSGRTALLELFDRTHAEGATLLVATHELTTVAAADRVIALRDGEVVFDGEPGAADLDDLVRG